MAGLGDGEQDKEPNPLKVLEQNRSLLFSELELSASFSDKGALGYTLLVIDLNDFKQINIGPEGE